MLAEREVRRVHLPDHAGVRVAPPLVFAGAVAIGVALHWLVPIAPEWAVVALRAIGAVLIVVGAWIVVEAVRRMRAAHTSPIPARPTTALVLDGPYRYTRNPMYCGMLLASAGAALALHALWALLLLPFAVGIVNREVIVREEKYLSRKFGGEYEVYKRRTRRWL